MTATAQSLKTFKSMATLLAIVVLASLSAGCAIRTSGPARAVAYDYSDHQHYDRVHAPSPVYRRPVRRNYHRPIRAERHGRRPSARRPVAVRPAAPGQRGYVTSHAIGRPQKRQQPQRQRAVGGSGSQAVITGNLSRGR